MTFSHSSFSPLLQYANEQAFMVYFSLRVNAKINLLGRAEYDNGKNMCSCLGALIANMSMYQQ